MTGVRNEARVNDEDIVVFITRYLVERRFSPSIKEVARGCGMSQSAMKYRLDRLEREGRIEHTAGIARSLRLVPVE